MAYFCYPLARLFYLRQSVLSPCFHTSLVVRFTSGCGQLPFTLCSVAIAVSVCASICGARIHFLFQEHCLSPTIATHHRNPKIFPNGFPYRVYQCILVTKPSNDSYPNHSRFILRFTIISNHRSTVTKSIYIYVLSRSHPLTR